MDGGRERGNGSREVHSRIRNGTVLGVCSDNFNATTTQSNGLVSEGLVKRLSMGRDEIMGLMVKGWM